MDYKAIYMASGRRRDKLAERDWAANDPTGFQKLEPEQQTALVDWIRNVLAPAKGIFRRNSYGMKHDFAREPDGLLHLQRRVQGRHAGGWLSSCG
jgi:hypothetical protein